MHLPFSHAGHAAVITNRKPGGLFVWESAGLRVGERFGYSMTAGLSHCRLVNNIERILSRVSFGIEALTTHGDYEIRSVNI